MWCKHCRQDVPAIASADETAAGLGPSSADTATHARNTSGYLCTRCGEPIGSLPAQWTNVSDLGIDLSELSLSGGPAELPLPRGGGHSPRRSDAPARFDAWQWELDQELYDVRRLLARSGAAPSETDFFVDLPNQAQRVEIPPVLRVATGAQATPQRARSSSSSSSSSSSQNSLPEERSKPWAPLAWMILMLGLTATCCGGALLAWSVLSGRDELWSQGVPILIGGQVALFVALVAMLLRLGKQSQLTSAKLHALDSQLSSLSQESPSAPTPAAHQPFYVHLAEGAHPQALLSDLKNQLDLLAISMKHRNT